MGASRRNRGARAREEAVSDRRGPRVPHGPLDGRPRHVAPRDPFSRPVRRRRTERGMDILLDVPVPRRGPRRYLGRPPDDPPLDGAERNLPPRGESPADRPLHCSRRRRRQRAAGGIARDDRFARRVSPRFRLSRGERRRPLVGPFGRAGSRLRRLAADVRFLRASRAARAGARP